MDNFAKLIAEDDYHLSAGFVGMPFLLNLLKEEALVNLAWKIATQETYPGWYDMVLNKEKYLCPSQFYCDSLSSR